MLIPADSYVSDLAGLEARLGPPSQLSRMLEIDHIDAHARRLLAEARLAVIALRQADGTVATLPVAARHGLCRAEGERLLRLRRPAGMEAPAGAGVGTLLVVPGVGETVRVNGRLVSADGAELVLGVEEVIVHCAKAFLRSDFWAQAPGPSGGGGADGADALRRSALACIGSAPRDGPADVSPKGERGPVLQSLAAGLLGVPERPGNRRHDTFRNIVEQPQVGLLLISPHSDAALHIQGEMRLVVDDALNRRYAADDRPARAVALVRVRRETLLGGLGLSEAGLWDRRSWPDAGGLPSIGEIMHDHIRLHRDQGAAAQALRASIDREEMEAEAKADYADGLW